MMDVASVRSSKFLLLGLCDSVFYCGAVGACRYLPPAPPPPLALKESCVMVLPPFPVRAGGGGLMKPLPPPLPLIPSENWGPLLILL